MCEWFLTLNCAVPHIHPATPPSFSHVPASLPPSPYPSFFLLLCWCWFRKLNTRRLLDSFEFRNRTSTHTQPLPKRWNGQTCRTSAPCPYSHRRSPYCSSVAPEQASKKKGTEYFSSWLSSPNLALAPSSTLTPLTPVRSCSPLRPDSNVLSHFGLSPPNLFSPPPSSFTPPRPLAYQRRPSRLPSFFHFTTWAEISLG